MLTDPVHQQSEARPSAVLNGFWNAIGTGTLALGGVISSVIVVRSLSVAQYGRLSFYLWLGSALASLGLLSFPPALTKVVSQLYGAAEYAAAASIIPWVGQILFYINIGLGVAVALYALFEGSVNRQLLLVVAVSLLPGAMARVLNSRVLAQERYRISMIASICIALAILAGVVIAHALHWKTVGYEAVLLSAGGVQMAVLLLATRGATFVRFGRQQVDAKVKKIYLTYLFPSLFVTLFDLVVWQRSEIYFLNLFAPMSEIGLYSISYTLFSTFNLIGGALLNGLFPSLSHDYGAGDLEQLAQKSRAGIGLAVFYALPVSLGGIVAAPTVLALFYGPQIAAAGPVASILMAGVLPGALAAAMAFSLSAGGRVWKLVGVGAVFAAVNLVLDLVLIPHGFSTGAALANTLTQYGYAIAVVAIAAKEFHFGIPWRWLAVCAVFSVALPMGLPLAFAAVGASGWTLLSVMGVGYVAYWVVCRRFGAWQIFEL